MVALRDGIPLRDALERLGIDTAPLDLPPPPEAVPFSCIAPSEAFTWQGHIWTRAALHHALAATPERRDHPQVVAAYLAATQRGQAANVFRWASGEACLAECVDLDVLVYPATQSAAAAPLVPEAWISTADASPDLGRTITVDTPAGPVTARLLLDDEASGGAAWHTAGGERLDLDEVSGWHP